MRLLKYSTVLPLSVCLFMGLASGALHATTYEIDPAHANVRFAIDHFGTSTNTGGFYNLTGEVEYDPKQKYGKVSIVIPLDSVNTGNKQFDETLKGKDFFEVEKFPTAKFESTQWHFSDQPSLLGKLFTSKNQKQSLPVTHIDGNLSLHGQTHPVTLEATKFNCYLSPILKKSVCGGDFTTTIDRTKWGISKYVLLGMTKDVGLNIQIEAAKK